MKHIFPILAGLAASGLALAVANESARHHPTKKLVDGTRVVRIDPPPHRYRRHRHYRVAVAPVHRRYRGTVITVPPGIPVVYQPSIGPVVYPPHSFWAPPDAYYQAPVGTGAMTPNLYVERGFEPVYDYMSLFDPRFNSAMRDGG